MSSLEALLVAGVVVMTWLGSHRALIDNSPLSRMCELATTS